MASNVDFFSFIAPSTSVSDLSQSARAEWDESIRLQHFRNFYFSFIRLLFLLLFSFSFSLSFFVIVLSTCLSVG